MIKVDVLKVRRLMKAKGLTIDDLAPAINAATVEHIQRGKDFKSMTLAPLLELGKALKVSPFALILNQVI